MLKWSFLVDGVEIATPNGTETCYVLDGTKIEHTREDGTGNFATVRIANLIDDVLELSAGMDIVICRGEITAYDRCVFKGKIKSIDVGDNYYECTCADKMQQLKYKLFTKSYDKNVDAEAGEVSAIFKDIAEDGGFTVSTEDSGTATTDTTLDKFRNRNDKRLDRMNILSRLIDWVFYYDYDNDWIRHEPKGYVEYPNTLIVGDNVLNTPVWEENIEGVRNNITVVGASQLDTRIESFSASSDTEFQLSYTPVSIEVTVDGTLQVLGKLGATTTYDYTLDEDLMKIKFLVAQTGTVVATYTAKVPTPVTGRNVGSIETYDVEQEDIFTFDDISTIADAEARLSQLLIVLGESEKATSIFTTELNIVVGNKINYQNPYNSRKDGPYYVSSIIMNFGLDYDIVKIGTPKIDINKIFMTFNERLKYIEGTDTEYVGILRRLFNLMRSITPFTRRYMIKQKVSLNDTPIYDRAYLYDADVYYDVDNSTTENYSVIQGQNTYKELFYDDDFFDSDNSTGDWNTTNKQIELYAGEVVYTTSIFKDGTETEKISSITYSITSTGDVTLYGRVDGTNWEELTASPYTFTNLGYSLELKIEETGASTATVSYIEVKNGN